MFPVPSSRDIVWEFLLFVWILSAPRPHSSSVCFPLLKKTLIDRSGDNSEAGGVLGPTGATWPTWQTVWGDSSWVCVSIWQASPLRSGNTKQQQPLIVFIVSEWDGGRSRVNNRGWQRVMEHFYMRWPPPPPLTSLKTLRRSVRLFLGWASRALASNTEASSWKSVSSQIQTFKS